jgi:hypothetical protein
MDKASLKDLVREYVATKMFEAIVHVESDRTKNLTGLLDQLRGVCGITVITVLEPARPLSQNREQTKIKCKFLQTHPSLRVHLKTMKVAAMRLPGVHSFRVIRVDQIETKEKRIS